MDYKYNLNFIKDKIKIVNKPNSSNTNSSNIINCTNIRDQIVADLEQNIVKAKRLFNLQQIKLIIILVGQNRASLLYINNKILLAEKLGIIAELVQLPINVTETILLETIDQYNKAIDVSAIIVQMPLPDHISQLKVICAIDPKKDVDGFHPLNLGLLYSPYQHKFVPCTALSCFRIIKDTIGDLAGKNVVVIGRSQIVGRPLAALLLKHHAVVTICHSKTENLSQMTKRAQIVVCAIGRPYFFTNEYFNQDATVIDVGINSIQKDNTQITVGDVDHKNVNVKNITTVPGGVGPVSVSYLMLNSLIASIGFENYQKIIATD